MSKNRYEVDMILNALRVCLRRPILFLEGAGLLAGFMCFNFLARGGLLSASKAWVFPPLLLAGLFILYVCVVIGNSAAIALLRKGDSHLAEWSDVLPPDRRFTRSVVMSVLFFGLGGVVLAIAVIISLPAKALGAVWLAFFSLPVIALCAVSVVIMFQGMFLFPSFLTAGIDDGRSFQRFQKFLQVNWDRILRFEGLFLGIAILLALPQAAIAYLCMTFLQSVASSLGVLGQPGLREGFPGLVVAVLAIAPVQALCALVPTSFLTAACYLFCTGKTGEE